MRHTTEQKSTLIFAGMMTYIPNSPDMSPDESLHYARMAVQHAKALEHALGEQPPKSAPNISMEFEATHPDDMPQQLQTSYWIHPIYYVLAGIGIGYLLTTTILFN